MSHLDAVAEAMRIEWAMIVRALSSIDNDDVGAAAAAISYASKVGKASIERKLRAALWAVSEGMSPAVIIEMGQEAVVSAFQRNKKVDQLEEQVWLKWKVSGSLRDQFEAERERIMKLLKFTNSEQFVVWLHAQIASASDDEVRHSAGETS